MADWGKLGGRGRVEDRRAFGPAALGGGLGITGIVMFLVFSYLTTGEVNLPDVLNQLQQAQVQQTQSFTASDFEGADTYEVFASTVLGSNNDMWRNVFAEKNLNYEEPTLVLFRTSTQSACGGATSNVGPHYCPYDKTIYLDETFFDLLGQLGGSGDVAQAYVIAHEVGHHVQNELSILGGEMTNEDSVQIELQADCFAGLWAYSIKDLGVIGAGEIKEAIDAAAAVGDDRIQSTYGGRVNPETWTHGSSEARVQAFTNGFTTGSLSACL
jgi:predicted metalloprotease